ncbi:metallophosphoesterase [Microlunatus parietis]|uniref:3',5'-cyclic AMP phosphodiesterase CpdA n=1 Tax=Microlunatus parietis TaxID=682979 RepID=A0A7Y9I4W8_9ACTN|nr:metallophosphoesterase [Microlunatus parietis]NYE70346.1 3',5'-cyclic AMP phosphodiesterase CpdA [Microlunatus parietis]
MDGDGNDEAPVLSFGVVADCQYAAAGRSASHPVRHYPLSLAKLAEAVATFNADDLAFVISLGDLIDSSADDLEPVLDVLADCRAPVRHCLGNHDLYGFGGDAEAAVAAFGMPGAYYGWSERGHRFLVLDTNRLGVIDLPPGSPAWHRGTAELERRLAAGEPQAQPWNGGVDPDQLSWLGDQLGAATAAGEPVVIFAHQPVTPIYSLAVLNAAELGAVLTQPGSPLLAYLCGHDHSGGLGWLGSRPAVALAGMVDTERNAYAVVRLYEDRLTITGYGREATRTFGGVSR